MALFRSPEHNQMLEESGNAAWMPCIVVVRHPPTQMQFECIVFAETTSREGDAKELLEQFINSCNHDILNDKTDRKNCMFQQLLPQHMRANGWQVRGLHSSENSCRAKVLREHAHISVGGSSTSFSELKKEDVVLTRSHKDFTREDVIAAFDNKSVV